MHAIIDSPYNIGEYADRLYLEGVRTVIRYYNNRNSTTFPNKCLTLSEKEKLFAAGLNVAVVFQQRGGAGGFPGDLSGQNGTRDAARAVVLAGSIGQPEGSAIYFGVDHDFYRPSELDQIERYFRAVSAQIDGRYRLGVYGSGAVCRRLKTEGLVDYFWLPASMGWSGTRAFLSSQEWTLFQKYQNIQSPFGGFDYDGNILNPTFADFGQFGPAPTISRLANPVERASVNQVAVYEVIARSGLNVRGGAGQQYAVSQTLPLGSVVHAMGHEGDWIQVDVQGDGAADGFMAQEFLKPLSGGMRIPVAAGVTAYAIAQQELTLNVAEFPGVANNPRIVLYHSSTDDGEAPDETAWCSSFVNYCVEQAGMDGTGSKWARSWHEKNWGQTVTDDPRIGDIVVWRRQAPGQDGGHVAFFVEELADGFVRVLGGNQSDRLRISTYPKNGTIGNTRYSLLSIRR